MNDTMINITQIIFILLLLYQMRILNSIFKVYEEDIILCAVCSVIAILNSVMVIMFQVECVILGF